jgi:hypothetical protein
MTVSANGPIVVNRTIFVKHGMTSKIGVTAPQRRWYFATGPQRGRARYWIGVINPANAWTHLTLYTYRPDGAQAGTTTAWLKPHARAGYLINKIAHMTNAAVVVNTSRPIVAEQTTYLGNQHNASTDTFGVPAPGKSWAFAAVNTNGRQDALTLFNPSVMEIPVVVQFMDASGQVTNRTYIVGPFSQTRVDVGSVAPNSQLGIVATSNYPFVALNRTLFNGGMGSMSSPGIAL